MALFDEPVVMEGDMARLSGYSLESLGCACALGQDVSIEEEVISGLGASRAAEEVFAGFASLNAGLVRQVSVPGPKEGIPGLRAPAPALPCGQGAMAPFAPKNYGGAKARPPVPAASLMTPPRLPGNFQFEAGGVAQGLFGLGADPLLTNGKALAAVAKGAAQKAQANDAKAAAYANAPTWDQAKEGLVEAAKAAKAAVVAQQAKEALNQRTAAVKAAKNGNAAAAVAAADKAAVAVKAARVVSGMPVKVPVPSFPELPLKQGANRMDLTWLNGVDGALGASLLDSVKKVASVAMNPAAAIKGGIQAVKTAVGAQAKSAVSSVASQATAKIDAAAGIKARQAGAVAEGAPPVIGANQLPKPPGLPQTPPVIDASMIPGPAVSIGGTNVPMLAILAGAGLLAFLYFRR